MLGDASGDHYMRLDRGVANRGAQAIVDNAAGQVKQQIERARAVLAQQPVEQFRRLRPDARQGGDRREQGVEQRRTNIQCPTRESGSRAKWRTGALRIAGARNDFPESPRYIAGRGAVSACPPTGASL